MKLFRAILPVITAIMVMLTSNGIVYEYYFCKCCNEEHAEVSLFEFGEISHNHECHSHHYDGHHCHCQDKSEHQKRTHVIFLSLKDLFQQDEHSALPEIPSIKTFISNNFAPCTNITCTTNEVETKLLASNANHLYDKGKVCPLLSCFRL